MKLRFILNPHSGKLNGNADKISALAAAIQLNFPGADMRLTQAPGHATELAREAAQQGCDAAVAIGGDGTINETARGLVGTGTALAVIPHGSGNGFARELGMPLLVPEALARLQKPRPTMCDVGRINGELFLNLAGVGIEADIAWQFMEQGKNGARGMWPYFKIGAKTAFTYKPHMLRVQTDGQPEAFMEPLTLVFANGRQYGSNFKIAPEASLTDGELDMVAVADAPKWKLALAAPSFFTDHWRPFGITQTKRVKQACILQPGEIVYHIDGEPRKTQDRLDIAVEPAALRVWLPCL